ncbi:MAG: CmpA/NrtA family ABC transporter substrate-binding protein [Pseudomonadota bacterium]
MKLQTLRVGFVPLVDAAPVIVAAEMGLDAEEGLDLELVRAPTWSLLRDMVSFGQVDAAHMLAPIPVAGVLGLGGTGKQLHATAVMSINGNVVGVSRELAGRIRSAGHQFDFDDADAAGRALIAAMGAEKLRIGVPFPFSMHAELVFYWLTALGLPAPQSVDVRTVPPPLMAEALQAGEIDAFCVGEPWGSRSVEAGFGELLLPTSVIWAFAPEKVLALTEDFIAQKRELTLRLVRTIWRAGRWLSDRQSHGLATEILSKSQYLSLDPELLERALSGKLVIAQSGETREVSGFLDFYSGAAGFPWKSQAEWIASRIARRVGLELSTSMKAGMQTFRSDIYRAAMEGVAYDLPAASAKLEGALLEPTAVGSLGGRLILPRDQFFDGRIFEPSAGV